MCNLLSSCCDSTVGVLQPVWAPLAPLAMTRGTPYLIVSLSLSPPTRSKSVAHRYTPRLVLLSRYETQAINFGSLSPSLPKLIYVGCHGDAPEWSWTKYTSVSSLSYKLLCPSEVVVVVSCLSNYLFRLLCVCVCARAISSLPSAWQTCQQGCLLDTASPDLSFPRVSSHFSKVTLSRLKSSLFV